MSWGVGVSVWGVEFRGGWGDAGGGGGEEIVRTNVRRTRCFRAQCAPQNKPRAQHAYGME